MSIIGLARPNGFLEPPPRGLGSPAALNLGLSNQRANENRTANSRLDADIDAAKEKNRASRVQCDGPQDRSTERVRKGGSNGDAIQTKQYAPSVATSNQASPTVHECGGALDVRPGEWFHLPRR